MVFGYSVLNGLIFGQPLILLLVVFIFLLSSGSKLAVLVKKVVSSLKLFGRWATAADKKTGVKT